jgi:hypothetical protein
MWQALLSLGASFTLASFGLPRAAFSQDATTVAFVKISGGIQQPDEPPGGRGNKRGLNAPTHAFEHAVVDANGNVWVPNPDALVDPDAPEFVAGDLVIHYRTAAPDLGTLSCTFVLGMEGTVTIGDTEASLAGWTYDCVDEDQTLVYMGIADLTLIGRGPRPDPPKVGHTKDRGSICVDASDDRFDIARPDGTCVPLDRGNIILGVMDAEDGGTVPGSDPGTTSE